MKDGKRNKEEHYGKLVKKNIRYFSEKRGGRMALSASAEIGNPFAHNPNLILVPVIASFDTFGKIIPLYFRYEGLRLKIDHIKWFNDRTVDIVKFCCEITLQDRVQEVILYYHKKNGMWTLEKIRE